MKKWLSTALLTASFIAMPALATERADIGWEWIEQGAMLVDVRTVQEFDAGHLDNAHNFPLSDLDRHFANIDKDTQIVLYCRSGNRSGQAYQYLRSKRF